MLWTQQFDKRCVRNSTIYLRGNLSLTNYVGYDKLPFHERCGIYCSTGYLTVILHKIVCEFLYMCRRFCLTK